MSQSQQLLNDTPDPEFLMTFECSGPKVPQMDEDGEEVFQLWKIWNRSTLDTKDGVMCYEVQYYESRRDNLVHARPADEIRQSYPELSEAWENRFGQRWVAKYGRDGNVWNDPRKRRFEDTPGRARQVSKRRSIGRSTVSGAANYAAEGHSDSDSDGGTSIADTMDDDDDDEDGGLPNLGMAMEPPPIPRRHGHSPTPPSRAVNEGDDADSSGDESNATTEHAYSSDPGSSSLEPGHVGDGTDPALIAYAESQREIAADLAAGLEEVLIGPQLRPDNLPCAYDEYSQKLINTHEVGIYNLLTAAMNLTHMPCDGWVVKRKASVECAFRDLEFSLWEMLLSYHPLVLKHCVHGDLPLQYRRDPTLRQVLDELKAPEQKKTPCIYAQYFVSDKGLSPTPRELLEMLEMTEMYVRGLGKTHDEESAGTAALVDQVVKTNDFDDGTAAMGKRRYIEGPTQKKKCLDWVEALRDRLKRCALDTPLDRPLVEVGFASDPTERLKQHQKHSSSNYLMNLMEAVAKAIYPKMYFMEQYVVYHIFHYTQAMYAEILATRFQLGYTAQGGGFSHFKAGVSHPGAIKMENENPEYYMNRQDELEADSDFLERLDKELANISRSADLYNRYVAIAKNEAEQAEQFRSMITRSRQMVADYKRDREAAAKKYLEVTEPFVQILRLAGLLSKPDTGRDVAGDMEISG